MKNIRPINYLILALFLLFSCDSLDDTREPKIQGKIDSITIDFVKQYRDWCRLNRLIYKINLINNSNDTIKLIKQKHIEFCHLEDRNSTHYLQISEKIYNSDFWQDHHRSQDTAKLMILNIPENITIAPKKSYQIEYLLQLYIFSSSLQELEQNYKEMWNSNFHIQSYNLLEGYDTLTFQKSNDFKIIKKIDDKVVF